VRILDGEVVSKDVDLSSGVVCTLGLGSAMPG
jgi:hypothetical protein